ncbi:MAG: CHASE domain-containing protein [Rhodospirillaceae bacterium]|nr:CHASE domain-containing protein [Rhodospirillaceae bacterium]
MADTTQSSPAPRAQQRRNGSGQRGALGHRLRRGVVLALGVAISLALAATSDRMLRHETAIQDSLTRQSVVAGLQEHLDREFSLLRALKGLFESSQFVTRNEFRGFAQQDEHIRDRDPWLRVAWAEHVPAAADPAAAQDPIAEATAGHFPIRYLEPHGLADDLSGFDLTSDPASLAAMRQAVATAAPGVSEPIKSDLLGRGSTVVLVFNPVFRDVQGARNGWLGGFVVGAFAIDGLITAYLDSSVPEGGLAIRITADDKAVFALGAVPAGTEALPLRLGDRTWRIQVAANSGALQAAVWVPALVLLFGLSLTVLLFLHLLRIDGEYDRISAEVRAATGELARANDALAERSATLESLADSLRRTSNEAQIANAAKTMFLANMSHELRTPLNAMIGFAEIISRQVFGSDQARYTDYARDIHKSGLHLLGIIEDLLDMSRIELGKLQLRVAPANLATVVEDIVRLLRHRAQEQGVKIVCEHLDALPEMQIDARALRQAFINLVTNAIKFSRAGTLVTITGGRAPNGDVTVVIRDQGVGMDEAELARIFDPFWQADAMRRQSQEGVGLGLPITQRLIEAHGGSVAAESSKGDGTTMTIRLPHDRIVPGRPRAVAS